MRNNFRYATCSICLTSGIGHRRRANGSPALTGHVFLVPLMSSGAQREKDFPLLDRPELPAEKMRAGFEQCTEQQGSESRTCEIRLPDADTAREFHAHSSRTGRVRWEVLHAPTQLRPQPALLFANSFAGLIGTRGEFKGTCWRERSACTEPYQLCDTPTSIKDNSAVLPRAMLAHTRAGRAPAGNPQGEALCRFPNGALWQPALPC
jgi:hypothetical protein